MIINLRGTNGSGKSYIIHKLLERYGRVPLVNEQGKVCAYRLESALGKGLLPIYIVGRYDSPNGGCDTFKGGAQETEIYVEFLAPRGHVIFEGLVITGIAGRWVELAKRLPKQRLIFLTLDTPLQKCYDRVVERREARGNFKHLDQYNLRQKAKAVRSSHLYLTRAGLDVRRINHLKGYEYVKDLLEISRQELSSPDPEPASDEPEIRATKRREIYDFFKDILGTELGTSELHRRFGTAFRSRVSEINRNDRYSIVIRNKTVSGNRSEKSFYWSETRETEHGLS